MYSSAPQILLLLLKKIKSPLCRRLSSRLAIDSANSIYLGKQLMSIPTMYFKKPWLIFLSPLVYSHHDQDSSKPHFILPRHRHRQTKSFNHQNPSIDFGVVVVMGPEPSFNLGFDSRLSISSVYLAFYIIYY